MCIRRTVQTLGYCNNKANRNPGEHDYCVVRSCLAGPLDGCWLSQKGGSSVVVAQALRALPKQTGGTVVIPCNFTRADTGGGRGIVAGCHDTDPPPPPPADLDICPHAIGTPPFRHAISPSPESSYWNKRLVQLRGG